MDTLWLADYSQRFDRLALEVAMHQTEYRVLIADGRSVRSLAAAHGRLTAALGALRREWAARRVPGTATGAAAAAPGAVAQNVHRSGGMEQAIAPAGGAAALLVLAGWAWWAARLRKKRGAAVLAVPPCPPCPPCPPPAPARPA